MAFASIGARNSSPGGIVLSCVRMLGYVGGACLRVCVSVLVGASLGLLLGPLVAQAALHHLEGTAVGPDLSCCAARPGTEDYLSTLRWATDRLAALPERLSELS